MSAYWPKIRQRSRPPRLTFEGLEPRVCLSSTTGVIHGNYVFQPLAQSLPFAGGSPLVGPAFNNVVVNGSGTIAYTASDIKGTISIQRTDGANPRTLFDGAGPLQVLENHGLGIDGKGEVYFVGTFKDEGGVEHTALLSTRPGKGPQGFTVVADASGAVSADQPVQVIHAFSVNDAGTVIFSGTTAPSATGTQAEGIFSAVPSGSGYLVSQLSAYDPADIQTIGPGYGYHVNARDSLAFLEPLAHDRGGLMLAHNSTVDTLVTQDFGQLPSPGAATLRAIYSYDLSDRDTTAVVATRLNAKQPQNPSLFATGGGNIVTLLDGDSSSPTYPVTAHDAVAINSNNVVAFVGEGADSPQAIYLTTDGKTLQRVVSHGDQVGNAQVITLSLVDTHSLDDQGDVTFTATLSNGQVAVLRARPVPLVQNPTSSGQPTASTPSPGAGAAPGGTPSGIQATPANPTPGAGAAPGGTPSGVQATPANPTPGVGAAPGGTPSDNPATSASTPLTHGSNQAPSGTASSSTPTTDHRRKPSAKMKKAHPTKEMLKSLYFKNKSHSIKPAGAGSTLPHPGLIQHGQLPGSGVCRSLSVRAIAP